MRAAAVMLAAAALLAAAPPALAEAIPDWLIGDWSSQDCQGTGGKDLTVRKEGFELKAITGAEPAPGGKAYKTSIVRSAASGISYQQNGGKFILVTARNDGALFDKLSDRKVKLANLISKGKHESHRLGGTVYDKCASARELMDTAPAGQPKPAAKPKAKVDDLGLPD